VAIQSAGFSIELATPASGEEDNAPPHEVATEQRCVEALREHASVLGMAAFVV
jgi:hypothetical protein